MNQFKRNQFCRNFWGKFCWKAIGFALIEWPNVGKKQQDAFCFVFFTRQVQKSDQINLDRQSGSDQLGSSRIDLKLPFKSLLIWQPKGDTTWPKPCTLDCSAGL